LQGVYSNDDFKAVPFERPVEMGDRKYLTEEEYAKRVQEWQKQLQDDQSPTYTNPNRGEKHWNGATSDTGAIAANRSARHR
jgi:hypothetical protein